MKFKITIFFIGFILIFWAIFYYFVEIKKEKVAPTIPSPNWELVKQNPMVIKNGQSHFMIRCAKCHGYNAKGSSMAPNLTDNRWIYSNSYDGILWIISNGSPNKKMLGWGKKLKPEDLYALTLYVHSLSEKKSASSSKDH